MKKIALVILLLAAGFGSFAKTGKQKKKTATENEIVSVGVYHTVCFGRCPE
jgi:hypothetical protein